MNQIPILQLEGDRTKPPHASSNCRAVRMKRFLRRRAVARLALCTGALFAPAACGDHDLLRPVVPRTAQSLSTGQGDLRVMTYNVDEGSDFTEITNASSLEEFLVAVGQTIAQVRATNPAERMQAVAIQISAASPALVSLQEVDTWSSGPFNPFTGACGPVTVEFDMLTELLSALTAEGVHYRVAVQTQQYAIPPTPGLILSSGTFLCGQVFDYNVILARTDLSSSLFQVTNPQSGQFTHIVSLPTPLGPVPLPRVWSSVDVTFHGRPFRFLNTHLESFDPTIRELQAGELRAGPASTSVPVIIAMDGNAQAAPPPLDPSYTDFLAAGYQDAWAEVFPDLPGFTCCQAQLVNNPLSQLSRRIDLILTRGTVGAQNIAVFGADLASKTASGLWPSDHAGVAAQLELEDASP